MILRRMQIRLASSGHRHAGALQSLRLSFFSPPNASAKSPTPTSVLAARRLAPLLKKLVAISRSFVFVSPRVWSRSRKCRRLRSNKKKSVINSGYLMIHQSDDDVWPKWRIPTRNGRRQTIDGNTQGQSLASISMMAIQDGRSQEWGANIRTLAISC